MRRQLRVLVVEDTADDAELMILALQQGGLDLTWQRVQTADELSAALASESWDVVLSDYTLPHFGAAAALEIVRGADSEMPVLIVSGTVGEEVAAEMMRVGANDYVLKQNLTRLAPAVHRELREAENRRESHRVAQTAARLAAIVDSSDDAIHSETPDGMVTTWNRAAERLYGWTAAEAIGRHISFILPPDKANELATVMEQLRRGERVNQYETVRLHRDGARLDVSITASAVRDQHGKVQGVSKIARDISERKLLEEQFRQAHKMEAFGQLAGGIAHDFNNLITIINGYSGVVLRGLAPDDDARGFLAEIIKAGERAAALTRQLLAFSRKQIIVVKMLDLNTIVGNIDKLLQRIIGEDIELVTSLPKDVGHVRADAGQLEQVLINLAVNARDAMPRGGKLTIETKNVDLDDNYTSRHINSRTGSFVLLAVSDSGCGMTAAVKARIFEPFFTTKGVGEGTGLGLATVYGIVKQAEGHVEVYSEVNVGTSFKIYLPRANRGVTIANDGDRSAPVILRGTESILLVEDDPALLGLLQQILRDCGYSVSTARNGIEALRSSLDNRHAFDLIVTDVVMPQMGGRQMVEQFVAQNPKLRILYMSGYTDDAVVRHGILHEQVSFLQKPFSPTALAQKVRKVLDS